MGNNVIKSIIPQICPHCKKQIMVEIQSVSPVVSDLITENDIIDAKEKVKNAATEILKGDKLKTTLEWLNDEDTIFGPNDIDSIIESFKE
ncbi:MAG: hypothetical protein WCX46_03815 [Candidatus Paceibacterota bacterium]